MPIIDFRLRPPLKGFLDTIMYANSARRDEATRRHGMEPAPSAQQQSIELLLEEMDAAGVTLGVVMGRYSGMYGSVSNRDIADIVQTYRGRFVGVGSLDPSNRRKAIAQIDETVELGLKGINLEPGAYATPMYADDRRLYPLYAHCEDRAIPVVVMAGGSAGPDLSYTDPVHVDRVAGDFPGLKLAVSHGGWPWVQQILHVAYLDRDDDLIMAKPQRFGLPGTLQGGDHHRLAGNLGAREAHRDANVGLSQGRGVIHAIAGHCYDRAARLPLSDDTQLVFG